MAGKKFAKQVQLDSKKICKAVHQYSSGKISREDMDKLLSIARDCADVSNYVYQKYGSIKSLYKIYPGYTVQNEMTASGLREKLNLPTVYFYPAVFNALKDIKTQWTQVKKEIYSAINKNERFTPDDKHYLRFAVKVDGCFGNILNGKPVAVSEEMMPRYDSILSGLQGNDSERVKNLNRYICRQNDIEIIEVLGNALSRECSMCGAVCEKQSGNGYAKFRCPDCGYEADRKVNAAKNVLNRGKTGRQLNKVFPEDEISE